MKILTVVSGLDFINYTRRATISAIHKLNPGMDVLQYNSILNIRKKKNRSPGIKFFNFHFWIPEKLRGLKFLIVLEVFIRKQYWKGFFSKYDYIFLIDPNQYYLLPFLSGKHKVIYLLRDPSILLDPLSYKKEYAILKRADLVLGISQNLCEYYLRKYYDFVPSRVKLWSNTVDLELWDYENLKYGLIEKKKPLIGFAGNIDFVIDIELLLFITEKLSEYDFEIAGKTDRHSIDNNAWQKLISRDNVRYLGFIPYNEFPAVVIRWDIGLVVAKPEHEYARYLNNNKQYQYLALGKPFVTYRLNADYDDFEDMVFIAENREDYLVKIDEALERANKINARESGLRIARRNSSMERAELFLEYLKQIN